MADIGLLYGAAVFAAGMVTGRVWPARRRRPKPPKPKPPVCGCRHELSYHQPDGDGGGTACHALMKGKAIEFNSWADRDPVAWEMVPCTCRQYTGPRVLDPGYVARELSDGS
jgi:hypothetical protein